MLEAPKLKLAVAIREKPSNGIVTVPWNLV